MVWPLIRREQLSNLRRAAAFTDGLNVPSRLAFDGLTRYKSRRAREGPDRCSLDVHTDTFLFNGKES
jgi:hypothetical protein